MTAHEYSIELCGEYLVKDETEEQALAELIQSHRRLRAECFAARTQERWAAGQPRYRDIVETVANDLVVSAESSGESIDDLLNSFMERLEEDIQLSIRDA